MRRSLRPARLTVRVPRQRRRSLGSGNALIVRRVAGHRPVANHRRLHPWAVANGSAVPSPGSALVAFLLPRTAAARAQSVIAQPTIPEPAYVRPVVPPPTYGQVGPAQRAGQPDGRPERRRPPGRRRTALLRRRVIEPIVFAGLGLVAIAIIAVSVYSSPRIGASQPEVNVPVATTAPVVGDSRGATTVSGASDSPQPTASADSPSGSAGGPPNTSRAPGRARTATQSPLPTGTSAPADAGPSTGPATTTGAQSTPSSPQPSPPATIPVTPSDGIPTLPSIPPSIVPSTLPSVLPGGLLNLLGLRLVLPAW
jgi:hypothetical protein